MIMQVDSFVYFASSFLTPCIRTDEVVEKYIVIDTRVECGSCVTQGEVCQGLRAGPV